MRANMGFALVVVMVVGTGLSAGDKVDAKKLLGKWESKEFKVFNLSKVAEFTKDGKAVFTHTDAKGNVTKVEGTYKLDGGDLIVAVKLMEKERKFTTKITVLTDDEMVGTDEKGFEGAWSRLKDR